MKKPVIVILAGGVGKRFAPLVTNKTLMPFMGKPLLQYQLEMLEAAGFRQALIATNVDNEEWLTSYQPAKLTIETKLQPQPLGMGAALLNLEQEIGDQPIVVMNAVDLINPNFFTDLLEATKHHYAYITGMKVDQLFPGGYLQFEGDKIIKIVEKPAEGQQPSDYVNLVFHYFSQPKEIMLALKKTLTDNDDHYEQALTLLMQQKDIHCLPYQNYWAKLKYSYHVLDVMDLILQHFLKPGRDRTATVAKTAVIQGNVFIDEYARIEDYAVIKGPAYIGKHVVIGNHTLVRQSVIEERSVVGFGSEVARSYIGPDCQLHHNFFGDSVLEHSVNPSYGTTSANLRIDGKTVSLQLPNEKINTSRKKLGTIVGKGVFCGVNCSFMPGVTVGSNARIFPGSVVFEAVKDNSTFKK